MSNSYSDEALSSIYHNRHPHYASMIAHWAFLEATYKGGRDWFNTNIFRYLKEGDKEYSERIERSYRFNHTREVVELVQKYLFKGQIARNFDEANDVIRQLWEKTTLGGLDISQFMRQVSVGNSIFGRVAVVVDNNFAPVTGDNRTVQDEKNSQGKIYAYVVKAPDILDYAWDEDGDGELLWVKLREVVRDDADPFTSTNEVKERVRLWTRTEWMLFEEIETQEEVLDPKTNQPTKKRKVVLKDKGENKLGFVPVKFSDHTISEDQYTVSGLIDDVAYLDRAAANYMSNLDAIIQDQTFSQLAIPSQSMLPGDDLYQKTLDMGTKRVFVYDGGAGSSSQPFFLSPDPKQASIILTVVEKIINEIYHSIGLAGERTKEDNAVGIDNSSGVAKAYDFERVNSLLMAKAQSCENVENWIVATACAWRGINSVDKKLVTYPTTFDIASMADDVVLAQTLGQIDAPKEVRREQMRSLVSKIFPQISEDIKQKLKADINHWLDDNSNTGSAAIPASAKPASAPNRQGEVTKDTD